MPVYTEDTARYLAEKILRGDDFRMSCLEAVASVAPPNAMIGAGFVRNMIWDALHAFTVPSALNDIDVVYFDETDISRATEHEFEQRLAIQVPDVKWEVRNQARMHRYHNDDAYTSTQDGIRRWVELPTCVGVRLTGEQINWFAPYGLFENWKGDIRINPAFPRSSVYQERIAKKHWTSHWPELTIIWP